MEHVEKSQRDVLNQERLYLWPGDVWVGGSYGYLEGELVADIDIEKPELPEVWGVGEQKEEI